MEIKKFHYLFFFGGGGCLTDMKQQTCFHPVINGSLNPQKHKVSGLDLIYY